MATEQNETLLEETPVDSPADAAEVDSNLFSELADDMLSDGDDEVSDTADVVVDDGDSEDEEEVASGETETAVETAEETPEPEAVAPEVDPQQQTQQDAPEAQPEAPAQPAEESATAEPVDFSAMRTEALQEIEARYAISEEDVQTLGTDPEKILPKLAARVYMDAFENISQGLMASLPRMIQSVMQMQTAAQEGESEFYGKWEGRLDKANKDHRATVQRIANVYAQVNPTATRERFIAEVGAQALMALGIPFEQIVDEIEDETPPTAFTPAKPGGTAAPAPARKPGDEWSALAEDFIIEELDD